MQVTIIAAVADDQTLATEDGIPWDIPSDRDHFRAYCTNKPLIVGRRTYEEMEEWFKPGQTPIVVTRESTYAPHTTGTLVATSVTAAIDLAKNFDEVVIIGGAMIYEAAMEHATTLVITQVHGRYGGPVFFPLIDPALWTPIHGETISDDPPADIALWERLPATEEPQ